MTHGLYQQKLQLRKEIPAQLDLMLASLNTFLTINVSSVPNLKLYFNEEEKMGVDKDMLHLCSPNLECIIKY